MMLMSSSNAQVCLSKVLTRKVTHLCKKQLKKHTKTERDKETKRQKYRKTERQKDRKTEGQKDIRQKYK